MSEYPSPYDVPADQTNAFDGWYRTQVQLPPAGGDAAGGDAANRRLPEGWEEMRDPHSGRIYYVDHSRQVTTWDRPECGGGVTVVDAPPAATNDCDEGGGVEWRYSDGAGGEEDEGAEGDAVSTPPREDGARAEEDRLGLEAEGRGPTAQWTRWEAMMEEISAFKERHGHVNVTRSENAELEAFVAEQQRFYRRRLEGETNCLTDDRIRELEGLGFRFAHQPLDAASARWERKLEGLKAYKEANGHTNVPQKDGSLGRWVNHQRQFYAKRIMGERSCLTEERVKALDEIGFVWALKSPRPQPSSSGRRTPKKRKRPAGAKASGTISIRPKITNPVTELLPDGTHVIRSGETYTHSDGSKVEVTTKEMISKRRIRLADGTSVLETTTETTTRRVERMVIPSLLTEELEIGVGNEPAEEGGSSNCHYGVHGEDDPGTTSARETRGVDVPECDDMSRRQEGALAGESIAREAPAEEAPAEEAPAEEAPAEEALAEEALAEKDVSYSAVKSEEHKAINYNRQRPAGEKVPPPR